MSDLLPVTTATGADVRVRFCPSPTGNPHVGMVRTALFNWAFARHHGGTFVFRIEDTDAARDSQESYEALLDSLRWLGLNWDEGPEVGGPHEPYRQSQRMPIYADIAARLRDAGEAYDCYCSSEELEARRTAQREAGLPSGYDGHCRDLSSDQVAAYVAEGRESVLRLRMPHRDHTWDDLVRGPITFAPEHVPDFALVRANGDPLYTLVNPVDDVLMQITHVLRGEDLLSSTPRQLALYEALARIGVGNGFMPRFGHLPYVMGEGNKKLSKRDPESSLLMYRETGYLPEGLLNYLALLGWSLGDDIEFFSLAQMAAAFEVSRVSPNPARFDLKKCTAINADWIRALTPEDLASRLVPFLQKAGLVPAIPSDDDVSLIQAIVPLVQERIETLSQAIDMVSFLFVDDASFELDEKDAAALLGDDAKPVVAQAISALEQIPTFDAASIEAALRGALIEGMGLKPKVAFGGVRVAITGRRISPPLFESMELLGRERSMHRLREAIS